MGCPDRTLAVVGAARYLAIAPRSHQHSLNRLNAEPAGPHPALADAAAMGVDCSGTIRQSCRMAGDEEHRKRPNQSKLLTAECFTNVRGLFVIVAIRIETNRLVLYIIKII